MKFYFNLTLCFLVLISVLSTGCGGGAQPAAQSPVDTQGALAWPPPIGTHTVSDHGSVLEGVEYAAAGGNVADFGSDLMMTGGGNLPWAIYAMGELGYDNELVSISAVTTATPDDPGDGTELYYAVANHHLGIWVWIDAPTAESPWSCPEIEAHRYRNDLGYAHLAVVLSGPGTGRVDNVTFTHEVLQVIVDAPENLTAEATAVHEVTLDWDDVPGADGYNVFRSTDADFSSQAQVNTEPVVPSTFVDSVSTDGRYYFYRVTALATNESDPSNIARAWVFGDDLPAPFDLQVTGRGDGSFTAGWDWDDPVGGNPYGFRLFIDTVPFFTLASETMAEHTTFGAARSNTFHGLEPGVTYYWKLCAYDGMTSPNGRMSEEMTGTGTGSWTWGAFEVIGTGQPPVRAVVGDSEIAVSYFNGFEVDFAIQDGASWRIETPIHGSLQYQGRSAGPFTDYQDICYASNTFLLTAFAHDTGDCWIAEWDSSGSTGDWSQTLIHGDGRTTVGSLPAPKSGLYAQCAGDNTEFGVLQYYLTDNELHLHTRDVTDAGGSWSDVVVRDDYTPGSTLSHSMKFRNGNLFVLQTDNLSNELYFGDRTGGWVWADIRGASDPKLAKHHDLHWFADEWWSTGYQTADKDLYLVHGTTTPWTVDREDGVGGLIAGYHARMDVEGDEAVVIQFKEGKYHFALYSEGWDWHAINVPAVADYGADADVLLRNGTPYIAFQDEDTNEIKIAMGTPPV